MLHSPAVKLLNMRRAAAYTTRFHFLSSLILPEGDAYFEENIPDKDTQLLASPAHCFFLTRLIIKRHIISTISRSMTLNSWPLTLPMSDRISCSASTVMLKCAKTFGDINGRPVKLPCTMARGECVQAKVLLITQQAVLWRYRQAVANFIKVNLCGLFMRYIHCSPQPAMDRTIE